MAQIRPIVASYVIAWTALLTVQGSEEVYAQRRNRHEQKLGARSPWAPRADTERSDDLTFEELRAVVLQQAQTVQALQSSLEAEKNYARSMSTSLDALKAEVGTLKNRLAATTTAVGFTVKFGSDGGQFAGVPLSTHGRLIFDSVFTNAGNGYNPQTGIFTVPVSGLYTFFLTQMTADNEEHLTLAILEDGKSMGSLYTEGAGGVAEGDTHDQGSTQVTAHLQAGKKVWVRQVSGRAVRGGWYTVFTGYLIQAD